MYKQITNMDPLRQYIREFIRSIYDEKAKHGKEIHFPDSVDHPIDMEKIIPANRIKTMPPAYPSGKRFQVNRP